MNYSNEMRIKDLAYIHSVAKELGLTTQRYRILLWNLTGKRSCKTMSSTERFTVKSWLRREKANQEYVAARGKREYVSDAEARSILG